MRAEPLYEKSMRIVRPPGSTREPRPAPLEPRPLVALHASTVSLAPSRVLALQRTSGNKAVGALLGRRPTGTSGADARTAGVRATIVMDDPIGVLPLLGFSESRESEIHVVVPSTDLDAELVRHMTQGVELEHVKISTWSFDIELEGVYISSFARSESDGEAVVQMTLSYASRRLK